jgi:hypothetical protein
MTITKADEASGDQRQGEASTGREGNREEKRKEWKLTTEIARRWSAVAKHGGSSMAAVANGITRAVSSPQRRRRRRRTWRRG